MAPVSPAAPLFVDTSAWVALLHRRDQAHERAASCWPAIRGGRRLLVTTNLVVAETHTILSRRLGAAAGLAFLDGMAYRPGQRIAWVDEELTTAATEQWLRRYRDKTFSLTDAVSFEVMRRENIAEAFAFDRHFARAGFKLLASAR